MKLNHNVDFRLQDNLNVINLSSLVYSLDNLSCHTSAKGKIIINIVSPVNSLAGHREFVSSLLAIRKNWNRSILGVVPSIYQNTV